MNERIRELQSKSYLMCKQIVDDDGRGVVTPDKWFDMFAELLIKECFGCIDIMEKIAESNNSSIPKDYDKHTYLETLDTMRGLLKTHFGVTE